MPGSSGRISGARLDYTPDSLTLVDNILDGFRADGVTGDQVGETLFGFGCYAGEVLTRHAGGRWRAPTADETAFVGWPILVELADGAPTLHIYVVDGTAPCNHDHWLDPGYDECVDATES